jgi:hypothetical protein
VTPPLDLAALEALLAKATTPSEWYSSGIGNEAAVDFGERGDGWADVCGTNAEANARLIVAAVNALPALVAALRAAEAREREARREGLRSGLLAGLRQAASVVAAEAGDVERVGVDPARAEYAAGRLRWVEYVLGLRVADALAAAEGAGEVGR